MEDSVLLALSSHVNCVSVRPKALHRRMPHLTCRSPLAADGSCGTAVYHDELRREEVGCRVVGRRAPPRRAWIEP